MSGETKQIKQVYVKWTGTRGGVLWESATSGPWGAELDGDEAVFCGADYVELQHIVRSLGIYSQASGLVMAVAEVEGGAVRDFKPMVAVCREGVRVSDACRAVIENATATFSPDISARLREPIEILDRTSRVEAGGYTQAQRAAIAAMDFCAALDELDGPDALQAAEVMKARLAVSLLKAGARKAVAE